MDFFLRLLPLVQHTRKIKKQILNDNLSSEFLDKSIFK